MDNNAKYVVGLDLGTENVRAVVLSAGSEHEFNVFGFGEGKSVGMRKGVPANIAGPAEAIDKVLYAAEQMAGRNINEAYVSINGVQVGSIRTEGMIVVGANDHEISKVDLERVEDAATTGRISANQKILDVVPLEYAIDGQAGIKNPLGMTGSRLEMRASVISTLNTNVDTLEKTVANANVDAIRVVPTAVAAARAVLTDRQRENGVAVIDFGAATTSIAVFEEGELQYTGVIPVGSNNVTNDLAIMLAITPELAEEIKVKYISGDFSDTESPLIKVGNDEKMFERKTVENVVRARLEDIFGEVRKMLKSARYDQRLPEGVVLTGGGAIMKNIEVFVRQSLETSVRIGMPIAITDVLPEVNSPAFATAVGLAMMMADDGYGETSLKHGKKDKKAAGKKIKKLFRF